MTRELVIVKTDALTCSAASLARPTVKRGTLNGTSLLSSALYSIAKGSEEYFLP
jgi:hypothetical protein